MAVKIRIKQEQAPHLIVAETFINFDIDTQTLQELSEQLCAAVTNHWHGGGKLVKQIIEN